MNISGTIVFADSNHTKNFTSNMIVIKTDTELLLIDILTATFQMAYTQQNLGETFTINLDDYQEIGCYAIQHMELAEMWSMYYTTKAPQDYTPTWS